MEITENKQDTYHEISDKEKIDLLKAGITRALDRIIEYDHWLALSDNSVSSVYIKEYLEHLLRL